VPSACYPSSPRDGETEVSIPPLPPLTVNHPQAYPGMASGDLWHDAASAGDRSTVMA